MVEFGQVSVSKCTNNLISKNFFFVIIYFKELKLPGCRIEPFGSIITGLGIKTSDIDCCVTVPQWERKQPSKLVFIAFHSLKSQSYTFTELQSIARAKVPLVKFLHIPTGRHCDASFKSPQGICNSSLLAHLLHLDPRVLSMAIIIKFWAKVHKLTGTNLMPNYGLILLVVFYLQQVNILPSVYELQAKLEPHQQNIVDHWETGFEHISNYTPKSKKNKSGLYELLTGFFEYYNTYDFAMNIVSVFLGCSVKRELFKSLNTVPTAFKLYDTNLHKGLVQPLKIYNQMCIQDPFDHSRNCAVAVSKKLFPKLIGCIRHASKCHKEKHSSDFLKAILTLVPNPPVQQEIRPKIMPQKPVPIPKVNSSQKAGFNFIKKFKEFQNLSKQKNGIVKNSSKNITTQQ